MYPYSHLAQLESCRILLIVVLHVVQAVHPDHGAAQGSKQAAHTWMYRYRRTGAVRCTAVLVLSGLFDPATTATSLRLAQHYCYLYSCTYSSQIQYSCSQLEVHVLVARSRILVLARVFYTQQCYVFIGDFLIQLHVVGSYQQVVDLVGTVTAYRGTAVLVAIRILDLVDLQ